MTPPYHRPVVLSLTPRPRSIQLACSVMSYALAISGMLARAWGTPLVALVKGSHAHTDGLTRPILLALQAWSIYNPSNLDGNSIK